LTEEKIFLHTKLEDLIR